MSTVRIVSSKWVSERLATVTRRLEVVITGRSRSSTSGSPTSSVGRERARKEEEGEKFPLSAFFGSISALSHEFALLIGTRVIGSTFLHRREKPPVARRVSNLRQIEIAACLTASSL